MRNKISDLTYGQVYAALQKLGGYEGVMKFLRGDILLYSKAKRWYKKDGVIHMKVVSKGRSSDDWIDYFKDKGFDVRLYQKPLSLIQPTIGVEYNIEILKGSYILTGNEDQRNFTYEERKSLTTKHIYKEAERRGLVKPSLEVACLIFDELTKGDVELMDIFYLAIMCGSSEEFVDCFVNMFFETEDPEMRAVRSFDLCEFFDCDGIQRWLPSDGFAFVRSSSEVVF